LVPIWYLFGIRVWTDLQ